MQVFFTASAFTKEILYAGIKASNKEFTSKTVKHSGNRDKIIQRMKNRELCSSLSQLNRSLLYTHAKHYVPIRKIDKENKLIVKSKHYVF